MSIAMILKVFSDCCVCFAILGAFPGVFPYSYPLLWPALLCGLAVGVSALLNEKGKRVLSRLCAAVPFLALLSAEGLGEMRILFPVMVYTAAVILRGRLQLEYYSYRQFFLRSLILLGGVFLAFSAIAFIETAHAAAGMAAYGGFIQNGVTLRYGIVHLLCGIILQRQLRLGMGTRTQGGVGQMAAMLGGAGVVIFGFLVSEPLLRKGATVAFNAVINGVFGAALAVLEVFTALLNQIELKGMEEAVEQVREDRLPAQMSGLQEMLQQQVSQEEASPSLWWVALVVVVLVGAMVLMFLSFRKKGGAVHSAETVTAVTRTSQEKKQARRSNRGKIRQIYREFLRQEKKRGLNLKKNYTSQDILQRVSDETDEEAASELRELYIRVRYHENCEVSRAQVDAARSALKRTRGGAGASTP